MWNRIKWWLTEKRRRHCKHDWVPARQFYREWEGKDYEYLEPTQMKYHPGYKAVPYICRKCHENTVTIEKIKEDGDNCIQQDEGGLQR